MPGFLRRLICRRRGHQMSPWRPTWVLFISGRVCKRCGACETRSPFDGLPRRAGA